MKFGWINGFGGLVVIIMLIPNIIYAVKNQGKENNCKCVVINAIEQIGSPTFFGWVFGFNGKVQILAPESVKEQYRQMIVQADEGMQEKENKEQKI